jgi:succinyl-diaminopimelate desuccinylase
MIIGCDEESNWQCVRHYFKHEEMPNFGFAPDADFPIINAEKGIFDVEFSVGKAEANGELNLISFVSGQRLNMVPDKAEAVIKGKALDEVEAAFAKYSDAKGIKHESVIENDVLTLKIEGKSAHGSTPEAGVNAGLQLAGFLSTWPFIGAEESFLQLLKDTLNEFSGEKLGIAAEDEASGMLTVNVGVMKFDHSDGGTIGMNIRYPVTHDSELIEKALRNRANQAGLTMRIIENNPPNYVDEHHPLIKTLQKVYKEQTGEEGKLIAIGGGTYARSLNTGVAFGALFPGREDVAHQKDEYMFVEDLLKAAAIYAHAIYELAK